MATLDSGTEQGATTRRHEVYFRQVFHGVMTWTLGERRTRASPIRLSFAAPLLRWTTSARSLANDLTQKLSQIQEDGRLRACRLRDTGGRLVKEQWVRISKDIDEAPDARCTLVAHELGCGERLGELLAGTQAYLLRWLSSCC